MAGTKLSPAALYGALTQANVGYYCGVPDSLLSPFVLYLEAHAAGRHDVAANEGLAIGSAIGHHLATGTVPLVYMQNSGLNHALEPLTSLAHASVMKIPMLLLIGWRGRPGTVDEPQHHKQGAITTELLKLANIPYDILNAEHALDQFTQALAKAKTSKTPYALLIEPGLFDAYSAPEIVSPFTLSRESALQIVTDSVEDTDIIVATNGKIGRELFEYREAKRLKHNRDLLLVGGMGQASSVAAGIALARPHQTVYCFDGDGSVLMHMGALATIGVRKLPNLYHIVLNNGAHDSTGGQSTVAFDIDLAGVARACSYAQTYQISDAETLRQTSASMKTKSGPAFLEIRVARGARSILGRPTISPDANKETLMAFLDRPRP